MSFAANLPLSQEVVCHETETLFDRTDCGGAQASRAGHARGRCDPAGRYFGTDVLSVEEAICRNAVRSGARAQATAGGERAAEEAGCRTEPGQGHSAGCCIKKVARPALRRDVVDYVVSHYGLTMRRACRLVKQPRSVQYYRSIKDPRPELRSRMREIAHTRVRYGYRRVHVLFRREGWQLGRNQAYRLYCEEQLQLRSKLPKRRKMVVTRVAKIVPIKPKRRLEYGFCGRPAC
ncbi:hypothetical protein BCEP27_20782 [Burkholderia cepacia]